MVQLKFDRLVLASRPMSDNMRETGVGRKRDSWGDLEMG